MLAKFQKHLDSKLPFLKDKKLLVALSGGIDSMVLVHLLKQLNYNISLAHCNFNLRGEESDGDEQFITEYAAKNNIPLFVTHFDTALFASDNKLSIQVAARQLRYLWFHELLTENNLDYLLTAHHLDDSLETFLINLTRGTGPEGLTGIPQQNEKTIRPLLPFTRDEIAAYVVENDIHWREDSSNASDKYMRNKLRHDMVPILKSLNPSFMASFAQTLENLQQAQSLVQDASVMVYQKVVSEVNNQRHINISELQRLPNYRAYLYQWLSPLGFTAWEDIYSLVGAQSGKQVFATGYRLLKDREILILEPVKELGESGYEIAHGQMQVDIPVKLIFTNVNKVLKTSGTDIIYVDAEKLKFPLFVRKWGQGDAFYPLGMKGQKKKVSKYFKDEKLSLSDKEDAWILCSDNEIVWIIGKRADERFKIKTNTTHILKIELVQ
jgi:tRNA(Ile)-lysidine synthase